MCGIVGKLHFDSEASVDAKLLRKMASRLRHRGPDDEGFRVDGPVGLGSRRLAIIDLTPQGHQPISNEDGTVWIVFNGEIYNFQALRKKLVEKGHRFRSRTDTEVIVHLYEEYGKDCVQHLRGMFAFAIWDGRNRTLFLARDRLGKKPLFYYTDGKIFVFASEPKAILADPQVPAEPDLEAIHYYLTFLYVPSPLSSFRGFRKLPPAHHLTIKNGSIKVERYWRLRYSPKINYGEDELCEELRHRLREAVRLRLISDVPLGAFLSGGIDSSAVVAFMAELSGAKFKTFSIGFDEDKYNELPHARRVAQLFGTDHHEFIVKPNSIEILPELVWHYNEPYADSSALPTYYLSKLAREYVTVALNGDAGDENFAGYPSRYRALLHAQRLARLPHWVRNGLASASRWVPDSLPQHHVLQRCKRLLERPDQTLPQRFGRGVSYFTDDMKAALYTNDLLLKVGHLDSLAPILPFFEDSDAEDVVEVALDVDVNTVLPDDLLVKVDIATMAHSLEARSPFVDHVFMEFTASMHRKMKLRGGSGKYILKKALEGILPAEIIHREKMGFGVPIDRWFREDLRDVVMDTLLSQRAIGRGYFRREAVRTLIDQHISGQARWHHQLWSLLMLELWHQMFIDKTLSSAEPVHARDKVELNVSVS